METETIKKEQTLTDKDLIKVLLVEDNADDSLLVEMILGRCSWPVEFAVESVGRLADAIGRLGGTEYDIVLLDLKLPDSAGVETVRSLNRINPHIPVVVLTGLDEQEMRISAIENGASDFLVKGQESNNTVVRTILYALARKKETEKARRELEHRVEERTAELSKANELLKNEIAQRKRVESNLRVSEANLRKVIVGNPDGIVIVDNDGIVRFVNPAAESLFGRNEGELIGEAFGFPMVLNETTELEVIHKTKGIVTAEMRMVEVDWQGQMSSLASLHNVTERKKAEEKMKEAIEMKSEFISTASHELRTPLTAIKEGVRLVIQEQTGPLNDEQKEFLGIVDRNVARLARLINDVLDFQKLENGKMKIDMQENNVNEIVMEIKETMLSLSSSKGLYLVTELDETIPKVRCDRDKITQVLTNIVSNAVKFTDQGGVTVSTTQNENVIQVSVSDTGPGIKKEDLPKLFHEFEQLATGNERKTGGSGLGLAISRKLMKKHNAKIWVESEPGKGTTFHFVLPIKERRTKERD